MKPKVTSVWFSDAINPWRALWLTEYQQSAVTTGRMGFAREIYYTKLIDLRKDETEILAGFAPDTRRLVRRAEKEGITFEESEDLEAFVQFFNKFSRLKKLGHTLSAKSLERKYQNLKITNALKNGEIMFSHLYLYSPERSRVVILNGASVLKDETRSISSTIINCANRGLHYYDMCLFKRQGYRLYDLGGYAYMTTDTALGKINDFKDEFGGELVREANHYSFLLHLGSRIINYVNAAKTKKYFLRAMSFFSMTRAG